MDSATLSVMPKAMQWVSGKGKRPVLFCVVGQCLVTQKWPVPTAQTGETEAGEVCLACLSSCGQSVAVRDTSVDHSPGIRVPGPFSWASFLTPMPARRHQDSRGHTEDMTGPEGLAAPRRDPHLQPCQLAADLPLGRQAWREEMQPLTLRGERRMGDLRGS